MKKSPNNPFFTAKNINVSFGDMHILQVIDLEVQKGEIVGIIGPNGCGKTTFLNSISGFAPIQKGSMHFKNNDIASYKPYKRARLGVGRSFQNVGVFKEMTLEENLMIVIEQYGIYPWYWVFIPQYSQEIDRMIENSLKEVELLKHKKSLCRGTLWRTTSFT